MHNLNMFERSLRLEALGAFILTVQIITRGVRNKGIAMLNMAEEMNTGDPDILRIIAGRGVGTNRLQTLLVSLIF